MRIKNAHDEQTFKYQDYTSMLTMSKITRISGIFERKGGEICQKQNKPQNAAILLAFLIAICFIAGTAHACSLDDVVKGSLDGSIDGDSFTAILLWTYAFPSAVNGVAMPTDGSTVVVGTSAGEVCLLAGPARRP